jgi:uncharacterized membrane protein
MIYSNECLIIGSLVTIIGTLLIYKSLRAHPIYFKPRGVGIIFLGPIPIVFTGSRKWIITALGIIIVFLLILNWRHTLISW